MDNDNGIGAVFAALLVLFIVWLVLFGDLGPSLLGRLLVG